MKEDIKTKIDIWDDMTNQYSLSKTLRFELKPVDGDGNYIQPDEAVRFLAEVIKKDQEIKKAYIALKPVLDKIHEQVIDESLNSEKAKEIDFSKYYEEYKQKKELKSDEDKLRNEIVKTFDVGSNHIKDKAGLDEKGKSILGKTGVKILTEAGILKYIEKHISEFISEELTEQDLKKHLEIFSKFFTYFSGYNQNRENYYVKDEKSTAVATRIVHNNLPKFCDNCIQFSEKKIIKRKNETKEILPRKEEYLNAYQFLKNSGKTTQIKDSQTNKMIEIYPISEKIFEISKFSDCLSQIGIEEYNKIIGHYNSLINLYNQARNGEKDFKKLEQFKTLYKQIGCGKRESLFETLKYDTPQEQKEANEQSNKPENLKELLELIVNSGNKYFSKNNGDENKTIYSFINFLQETGNFEGIYWSKTAIDKISNQYLLNWHEIQDFIKEELIGKNKDLKEICNSIATYDKKEEQLKIKDAVELSPLFEIIDKNIFRKGWIEIFFKKTVLEENIELIDEKLSPSKNLINLICNDIKKLGNKFLEESENILQINNYKNDDNKLKIKKWLDTAKLLLRNIKDFDVKESKVKGNPINPEFAEMLKEFLHNEKVDWFHWYDLVRNYLTKKPQDKVKENKLKLNFGKSNLLNGFVDSYSYSDNATQYGGYLFRKKFVFEQTEGYEYFLGISLNNKLFRCHLQDTIPENDKSNLERLEYYQAKSTTYFNNKYSENKEKLIKVIESQIELFIEDKSDEIKITAENIKKRDKKGNITPLALLERINKINEFKFILNNQKVLDIINITIQDLKKNSTNFEERAPNLKEIQTKNYLGVNGLKNIVDDLQTIAKENKVFNFFKVSQKEFNKVIMDENQPLFLFKIHNKDLSYITTLQENVVGKKKRDFIGNENLHTIFFRALMREYNGYSNIDLGKGEIFFRDSAITKEKRQIHKIGEKMINRKEKNSGSSIPENIHNELFLFINGKKNKNQLSDSAIKYLNKDGSINENKVFIKEVKHEIIKDKRFTEPKFQLHLSTILNFNPSKRNTNDIINDNFTQIEDIQFLGIDRGEKHLIYYSLVDSKGKILEQGHFDTIKGKNYLEAINEAAKLRREKQENWQQKGNISNLKDGYMSLVVYEIIQKMKDENGNFKPTFIIQESLNSGFKRSRQKFEQQVYQKFELALAKKLNYLVDKNVEFGEVGSISKALQLTPPVQNYQDIENRKQLGVMLYTRANYTSVTDPVTGWRKTIYIKSGSEEKIKEQVLSIFLDIGMDENGDYFFQYINKNTDYTWTLWSGKNGKSLERYKSKRGKDKYEFIIESYNLKEMLDNIFKDFDKNKSLLKQLNDGKTLSKISDKKTAWESLHFVIDLIQQIRNNGDISKGQDDNFLLSPVRNENGEHFDSRIVDETLPKNADANGAYNIACKGVIMFEHIKQWVDNGKPKFDKKSSDLDLFISDKEWDLWKTKRDQWEKELKNFASRKAKK